MQTKNTTQFYRGFECYYCYIFICIK
ncbi:protein of unknown function [Methylorubrum extorquens]|uniref:Uncharacterized protein n=1 Tax=Methylorubrum extorquens TaxID=408 RepID=A0A2N9AJG4_METEX|nr:protein of unknown function [Methylorubrum extorquens]